MAECAMKKLWVQEGFVSSAVNATRLLETPALPGEIKGPVARTLTERTLPYPSCLFLCNTPVLQALTFYNEAQILNCKRLRATPRQPGWPNAGCSVPGGLPER